MYAERIIKSSKRAPWEHCLRVAFYFWANALLLLLLPLLYTAYDTRVDLCMYYIFYAVHRTLKNDAGHFSPGADKEHSTMCSYCAVVYCIQAETSS